MGDEKEGPYKVVQSLSEYKRAPQYSIVKQSVRDVFLQVIIPDAGMGETARQISNLLNKEWREKRDREEADGTEPAE